MPSEYRYSSSLIIGVGIVHVLLGTLDLGFSILAVIFEPSANLYASGLWTSPFYLLCGLCGILASTRWYLSYQIVVFLLTRHTCAAAHLHIFESLKTLKIDLLFDLQQARYWVLSCLGTFLAATGMNDYSIVFLSIARMQPLFVA